MKDVLYFNISLQRHTMGRLRTLQTLMARMRSMIVGSVQCCTWPGLEIKSFLGGARRLMGTKNYTEAKLYSKFASSPPTMRLTYFTTVVITGDG
jgi:hypothetical protein